MAVTQTTILASGTTAAASTDVAVDKDTFVAVGIFSASSNDHLSSSFAIQRVTPGALETIGRLDANTRSTILVGPGTFRVARPLLTTAFGVYQDA